VTPEEVSARARLGGLTLAFDTNALFGDRTLFAVCDEVALYNARLARRGLAPIRLLVCTVAHAEKLFDLKKQFRGTFDENVILDGLRRKGLVIQPFEVKHALETAIRLGERHPTTPEWHAAKRRRCLECLGLPAITAAPGTGQECGATVDWLIGAHARSEGGILVSDDKGAEFVGLIERIPISTLQASLKQLLGEP
jgi:hypothetical protein